MQKVKVLSGNHLNINKYMNFNETIEMNEKSENVKGSYVKNYTYLTYLLA